MKPVLFTLSFLLIIISSGYTRELCIAEINFEGNDRTRESVIHRELTFQKGDCFQNESSLNEAIKNSSRNLNNTSLFVEIDHSVETNEPNSLDAVVNFTFRERWYIFPEPVFELSDRNFNEWWDTHNRDLSRVTYGLRVKDYNFRGNKEELVVSAETGYTNFLELSYRTPAIDNARNWGLKTHLNYRTHKDIAYGISNNQLNHFDDKDILQKRYQTGISLLYRGGMNFYQSISLNFNRFEVADALTSYNPQYLDPFNESTEHFYGELAYEADYDKRDRVDYPLEGYRFKGGFSVKKTNNRLQPIPSVNFETEGYYNPAGNFFLAAGLKGRATLTDNLPFIHKEELGYGRNFVRGYEYYVMRGNNFGIGKIEAKQKLFETRLDFSSWNPISQFQVIPVELFFKLHSDHGYMNSHNNRNFNSLENTLLHGYGAGIDFVTFYDNVLRIEYSMTNTGNSGFFVHARRGI